MLWNRGRFVFILINVMLRLTTMIWVSLTRSTLARQDCEGSEQPRFYL